MDKDTRHRIQRATQDARALLEREYLEQLEGTFDIRLDGTIAAEPGAHLDAEQRVVRDKLVAAVEHWRAGILSQSEAVVSYRREVAFTMLNRFVALKMLEARGLVQECLSRGEQSSGFKEFTGLAPGLVQLPDHGYRLYIESLFDEIGGEVRVLFDRRDPASLLWPRRQAFLDLLTILNAPELAEVWKEDETIGWVYQYFNSDEERRQMRAESQAPRNSRELAVRNQFFTPRYVVEFLTDNTLGRIWYEMRQGKTLLIDKCDYLVHRPTEIFFHDGEEPLPNEAGDNEELGQEELLKKPVYISFRPKKDPRDLKVLDPACGSGHFLLYAFDLLGTIYEEGWEDEAAPKSEPTGGTLREDYASLDALRAALPGLVLRHNLHGIDIDPRAAQIAALALWMRAQRAYNDFGIVRGERPPITKTNIVIAEPMPGEKELRKEFVVSLDRQLGQLVERVFDKMELAGEAGSLLKIEDEIQVTIRDIYGVYGEIFQKSDEERWRDAEKQLLDALRSYAEKAQNGQAYRRRLFAEDAAGGFAFIDICRQGYDVVLMNPPFGDSTAESKGYLCETYPSSRQDLSAAFVERALADLAVFGLTGVLSTDAGFFRRTHEPWRRNVVLQQSDIGVLAHLGDNVLDGAKVRVAAYTLRSPKRGFSSAYIRAISTDDRESREPRVRSGVEALNIAMSSGIVFCAPQSEFAKLPYAVFGYWCSPELRNAFRSFPALEEGVAHVRVGLQTSDDFRFLRLRWEVPPCFVSEENWLPFAKGGEYSPFHDDVHLLVRWEAGNGALAAFDASVIRNPGDYLKPGITYTRRTSKRFAPKVLPSGYLFADKGPAIMDIVGSPLAVLALLNSRPVSYLLSLGTGMTEAMDASNSYEVGLVQRLPVPPTAAEDEELSRRGLEAWMARAEADLRDETTALFRSPVAPYTLKDSIDTAARQLATHLARLRSDYMDAQRAIDRRVAELYRLSESDWKDVEEHVGNVHSPEILDADDSTWHRELAARLLQFLVGVAVGRWDARALRTGGPDSGLEEPFAPIPVHRDVGSDHDHAAVLVDDLGHPADMVLGIRKALAAASVKEPDILLGEAARYLGVSDDNIYSWFRNRFFADHVQRYSKSRRKAPIYWQLATPSASYSVWLYYHRFTKDTFYKVLYDYVTPKLQHEERKLTSLVQTAGANPTGSQRKDIAEQEAFVGELRAFHEEVARISPLWNPDLNDGVIINFALLWRLVPHHRVWQKECEDSWDKLVAGDYDWSHLAMHLWPERVVPKCAKDRSFAIAHGLEDVFWVEAADGKWQPRKVGRAMVDTLIATRTSPAVKEALYNLLNALTPTGGHGRSQRQAAHRAGVPRSGITLAMTRANGDSTAGTPEITPALLDAVKQSITSAADGASKLEILVATGLTESQWNAAINTLLTQGVVTKTEERRGTRYDSGETGGAS